MHVRIRGRRRRARSSCASTSRRASSRPCCAAGATREPPDITARICGICPVAYQMSACAAIEAACGVTRRRADPAAAPPHLLRRMDREPHAARVPAARPGLPRLRERGVAGGAITAGSWSRGSRIKKAGNELIRAGRRARGASRSTCAWAASGGRRPARELRRLVERLEEARELALDTVRWAGALDFPELEEDYEFVALSRPGPLSAGGRPARLEPRARHRAGRVRGALRRGAGAALDGAALAAARARLLSGGPHGALGAQRRAALPARP